jgi:hypothetical protein
MQNKFGISSLIISLILPCIFLPVFNIAFNGQFFGIELHNSFPFALKVIIVLIYLLLSPIDIWLIISSFIKKEKRIYPILSVLIFVVWTSLFIYTMKELFSVM